jgi:hypothetical protein
MPTLTKPCNCRWCKQPMAAGEQFKWHKAKRPVHGFTKGGASGTVGMVDCWKPGHVHDCLSEKVETERAAFLDEQCATLAEFGATAEQVADYRTRMGKS